METLNKLKSVVSGSVQEQEPLAPYTTFRIGGQARYFYVATSIDELVKLVAAADKLGLPYFVLGGGSNLLINDKGFAGLVIKSNFSKIKIKNESMEVEAGTWLSKAVGEALGSGLLGLEWATGIPGTIGGAICNNAGAYGGQMSDSIESVKILKSGKIKELKNKDCRFAYRESVFKQSENKDIILSAIIKLKRASTVEIEAAKEKIKQINKERSKKFIGSSVGSVFKNILLGGEEIIKLKNKFPQLPEEFVQNGKVPAGWLIDQCGLKGRSIGGATVSENHAGIIINTGGATAENVVMLISIIKQKVRSKFNLQLMEELEYVGF